MMLLSSLFNSALDRLHSRFPLIIYAITWTSLLTLTVALASFSPEIAFVSAISPASSFSKACVVKSGAGAGGPTMLFRVPLDLPGETVCLPAHMFIKSPIDLIVPPVFAALVVTGAAFVVRAVGLWENDDVQGL
ncbi:hypothetical protein QQ045_004226 [Rhodiola kirilowii]